MTRKRLIKLSQHLTVFALALSAVLLVSGCLTDQGNYFIPFLSGDAVDNPPDPHAIIIRILRCDKATNRLQAYKLVPYVDSTSTPLEDPIDSPINGKPCSVSTENQNRALSMSEAAVILGTPPPLPDQGRSRKSLPVAAATPATSLVDQFATIVQSLFTPLFPSTDAARLKLGCPAGLQAYLVNHVQNTVTAFSICPMQVLKEIGVASNPLQVALTPDGSTALVTSYDQALTFIDTATNRVTATLDLVNYTPSGIAISPDGKLAYLTNYDDASPLLVIVDIAARKVTGTIKLPYVFPRTVVLTPDGSQAWVNYYTGGIVSVVDLFTGTVAGTVNMGQLVDTGMAFNPTGTKAFIAVYPNQLYVVDTGTLAIMAKIPVGQAPSDVALTIDGALVLVTSETEPGTWLINARKNTLIGHSVAAGATGGSMGLLIVQ